MNFTYTPQKRVLERINKHLSENTELIDIIRENKTNYFIIHFKDCNHTCKVNQLGKHEFFVCNHPECKSKHYSEGISKSHNTEEYKDKMSKIRNELYSTTDLSTKLSNGCKKFYRNETEEHKKFRKYCTSTGINNYYRNETEEHKNWRIQQVTKATTTDEYKKNTSETMKNWYSIESNKNYWHSKSFSPATNKKRVTSYKETLKNNPNIEIKRIKKWKVSMQKHLANPQYLEHNRIMQVKSHNTEEYRNKIKQSIHKKMLSKNKNFEILHDENKLIDYIKNNYKTKPTLTDLSRDLNIAYTTVVENIPVHIRDTHIKRVGHDSNLQQDVKSFVEEYITNNIIYNTHRVIAPLELDIYLPEYNVAIEVNGDYYHSYERGTPKDYHYKKYLACKEKGIRLIQIWEHEWNDYRQRPILENIIKHACGLTKNKIYARKCKIKEIHGMTKEINDFINTNNIAGNRNYKDAICLYYNDKLVEAFTIGHAYFGKGKYDIEIIRGASLLDYTIVGGSSKLWNYIINTYMPKNNYKSCVYYVDNNYFNSSSQNTDSMTGLKYITHNISFKNKFIKTGEVKNRDPKHNKEIKKLIEKGEVTTLYNVGSDVYVYEKS